VLAGRASVLWGSIADFVEIMGNWELEVGR